MSNAPAILYENILTGADYTNEYTGTVTSHTAGLVITETPTAGSTTCNAIGIARHTLAGQSVTVEYNNGSWNTAATFYPTPGRTFLGLWESVAGTSWRITFSGAAFDAAVIKLGEAVRGERNMYAGHTPVLYNRQAARRPSAMSRGQYLGRQYHARRAVSEFNLDNVSSTWVRNNIVGLQDAANTGSGLFFNWRPDDHVDDTIYGFLTESFKPVNTGPGDLMSVGFSIEGNT